MLAKLFFSLFFVPWTLGTSFGGSFIVEPGIETTASAYIVQNSSNHTTVLQKNAQTPFPMASLSKLMSAMVFLDSNPEWEKIMEILGEDDRIGGKLYIFPGEKLTVKDLFYGALVGSANNATMALVRVLGISEEEFIKRMNEKAQFLGMKNTIFYDPTGLNPKNAGSAEDIILLLNVAMTYKPIKDALQTRTYEFSTLNTREQHRIKNTDELLGSFLNEAPYKFIGGKTGYLDEAGYCLAAKVQKGTQEFSVVVLHSKSSSSRFLEAKALLYWALSH